MAEIVVSAPGKVILHGEHSVVYGKLAVASSLNLRCFLRAVDSGDRKVKVTLPDIDVDRAWDALDIQRSLLPHVDHSNDDSGTPVPPSEECLQSLRQFAGLSNETIDTRDLAVISFLYLFCRICGKHGETGELPALHIRLLSQLPVGAGLGSSAAFSVCLAAILLQRAGLISLPSHSSEGDGDVGGGVKGQAGCSESDLQLINKWAFLGEKIIHGQPSGIDNSVSTFGGAIRFKNKQITQVEKMPSIKILLTNTKIPRSTKTLVAGVRTRHDKFPEVMSPVLQAMEGLAERSIHIYEALHDHTNDADCYSKLEELIDMNQGLLNTIGVGHASLDSVAATTIRHGVHTKLTGAGGGGCAFSLLRPETDPETISAVSRDLTALGFECWQTSIGAPGVSFHFDPHNDTSIPTKLFG